MIFTKDLLIKGLAGLSVCAAAVGTGYHFRSEIRELIKGNNWTPEEIKKALGLPGDDCNLPTETASPTTCDSITAKKLKAINFEGKTDSSLPSIDDGKKAKLTISKLTDQSTDFPLNYKFVLEPSATDGGKITIPTSSPSSPYSSFSIKVGEKVELKIKMNGDKFYLGRAWDIASLINKVGLKDCTDSNNVCNIDDGGVSVKHSDSEKGKKTKSSTDSSTGKIKVYSGTAAEGYNEGFKFVIEEGDITLTGGSSTSNISKLEEFETYEIKEDTGNQWYLTRKEKAIEVKKKLLGLPSDEACKLPEDETTSTCTLDKTKLNSIKFDSKGTQEVTLDGDNDIDIKLKISKSTVAPFAEGGYKLVLESNKNITIPGTTQTFFKKGTNTEFKIKATSPSSGGARTLTLEKAWTVTTLAANVGLNCPAENNTNKECSLNETGINVKNGDDKKYLNLSRGTGNDQKKVKYEVDQADFNQGFKFYTEESQGITLQDSTAGTSDPNAANKKIEYKGTSNNVFYEIKKDTDNNWYLTKKSAAA